MYMIEVQIYVMFPEINSADKGLSPNAPCYSQLCGIQ